MSDLGVVAVCPGCGLEKVRTTDPTAVPREKRFVVIRLRDRTDKMCAHINRGGTVATVRPRHRKVGPMHVKRTGTPEERFWRRVDQSAGPDGCWLWTGVLKDTGYARFNNGQRDVYVHRFAYELLVGPIPPGMEIDHVWARGCSHRNCVNPAHLEPVTHRENVLRGGSHVALLARRTHCKNGHEFTQENTYVPPAGGRVCRTCSTASRAAYVERQRAKAAAAFPVDMEEAA